MFFRIAGLRRISKILRLLYSTDLSDIHSFYAKNGFSEVSYLVFISIDEPTPLTGRIPGFPKYGMHII